MCVYACSGRHMSSEPLVKIIPFSAFICSLFLLHEKLKKKWKARVENKSKGWAGAGVSAGAGCVRVALVGLTQV